MLRPLIRRALAEDAASRDLTSRAVIPRDLRVRVRVVARAPGIIAGVKVAALTFAAVDPSLRYRIHRHSGAAVASGATILTVNGRARSIFAAERTALNFLGHLSGIATMTRAYVRRTRGTRARIYDTRKTLPGLRALEKEAVRAGGGQSHRAQLAEAILIKTNHLKALGKANVRSEWRVVSGELIRETLTRARRLTPRRFVEIEVTSLRELRASLRAKPDAILLDNWNIDEIRKVVRLRRASSLVTGHSPLLEVSGGVTLANVRAIAKTGVERISIGRLTHSAPALNVSLEVIT